MIETQRGATALIADPVIDLQSLIDQLKALRKGRGVFVTNIRDRVPPALREVCGVSEADGPAEIRRKVAQHLEHLAGALPADLRVAAMAAFAIAQDAQFPLYQDRVQWTAARINRDPRTARRRIDDAIHQLAQLAMEHPVARQNAAAAAFTPWHTSELRLVVTLEGRHAEAIEHRRVVANRDGLAELEIPATGPLAWSVHSGREEPASLLYGGVHLDMTAKPAPVLRLARILRSGEAHEYALWHRVPHSGVTRPWIACVPDARCDHFELRVRFGRERPPRRIWLMHGITVETAAANVATKQLFADAAGEVHVRFEDLVPSRLYGLRWAW